MFLDRKAQVFTWDLVFAMGLFLIVLSILISLWTDTLEKMTSSEIEYEISWLSTSVSEQLVRIPGIPHNWTENPNIDNIPVIGLADSIKIGNSTKVLDRVIDPDKLIHFINITENNYLSVRNKLLSSGAYDFYAELFCLNSSNRDCFEGLYIDTIKNGNITCSNGFNFTVKNHVVTFDHYIWVEAENFENPGDWDNDSCAPLSDCSNGVVSRGDKNDANASTFINLPISGFYNVWVRYYDFSGGPADKGLFKLGMNGVYSVILGHDNAGAYIWNNPGNVSGKLANLTLYSRANPGAPHRAKVDIILLTTNLEYVPLNTVPGCGYYGCDEKIITKCIIGNYTAFENVTYIVSDVKTMTFTKERKGITEDIPSLEPTARIKFVVYIPP